MLIVSADFNDIYALGELVTEVDVLSFCTAGNDSAGSVINFNIVNEFGEAQQSVIVDWIWKDVYFQFVNGNVTVVECNRRSSQ